MTEGRLENLDRPQGTEDEVARGSEDLQPPAGSQRSEQSARDVLAELESCLATHDLDQMVEFFTEDVVLLGDAEEAFGRDAVRAYLHVMADMEPTVHWQWNRVEVVLDAPGAPSDLPRRPRTERLATEAFSRVTPAVGRRLDRLRLSPRADAAGKEWGLPSWREPERAD